ncbi:MAG TPA: hypothetical protein VF514_02245, partial [Bacteroidota bacterium]
FIDTAVQEMPALTLQIELGGVQLRLYKMKEGDQFYLQSSATPQLFEVAGWRASQLIKRKKDFLGAAA